MGRKIGIIANSEELKETIENIYPEDIKNGKIIMDILDSERINEQGIELEKNGAEAIIARSGGYHHTFGKVKVPVINLRIYTQDVLYAIMTAEKYKKKLVLVLSGFDKFNYEEWKDLIYSELIMEKYNKVEEIEGVISKYKDVYDKVVIIGGGIPCSYAKSFNMDYVNITSRGETVRDVVSRAWEIVNSIHEQKYSNNVLKSILDHVHDAVIAINAEGQIMLFNERAEELLNKSSDEVLDKKLLDVFPELSLMTEGLKNKKPYNNKYNEIINIKNIVVAANISTMESEGKFIGVLCSFQDITKLQNLEKKIRYELNKKGLTTKYKINDIIAYDPAMKVTLSKAVRIGSSDSTVMIYGESGTGKEMLAQSIHNMSERSDEPFVAVNCAALTESLLESELFGYEEGAFTGARKGGKPGLFELAHGGTIFLDEINNVSLNLQTKLLRVLEEKEVMRIGSDYIIPLNVRVIAAANESLKEKVNDGSFRSDLFYRLNILELHIPPLRKRKMDILPIFKHFVCKYSEDHEEPVISDKLQKVLLSYSWPGNVRELRNVSERYVLFGELDLNGVGESYEDIISKDNITSSNPEDMRLHLKEIDKYVELKVIEMLEKQGMTKNDIAKVLGISRSSLWNKINSSKDMSKK